METVDRPVTVAQLTETKNASERESPCFVDHGNMSRAVPPATSATNP
jgi:hypothetical protein